MAMNGPENVKNKDGIWFIHLIHFGLRPLVCWDCGFESHWGAWICVSCECCVSAPCRSLVQRSPVEYGVSECDREVSIIRRCWPTGGCCAI